MLFHSFGERIQLLRALAALLGNLSLFPSSPVTTLTTIGCCCPLLASTGTCTCVTFSYMDIYTKNENKS